MRREVSMLVVVGVIVVVLIVIVGAYLLLGRPRGGTANIRMNPHSPGKLFAPGTSNPPTSQPSQPTTPK